MTGKRLVVAAVVGMLGLLPGAAHGQASARLLGRVTAKSAMLIDNATGEVLLAREPDVPLPPASTTKVLTALVVLQNYNLDRDVVVSQAASEVQPSKIYLQPGWRMKVRDLLYALLLNSANDASVALAEGLAGSVPRFAARMNATAQGLGASNSSFVNPNGLPDDDHFTTARDLIIIMRQALRTPLFRDILSTRTTAISPAGSHRLIKLHSHNRFIDRADIPVIGKTGFTRSAKRCFVGVAINGNREVLVAMLGSSDLWGDLRRLVDYAYGRESDEDDEPPANWAREAHGPARGARAAANVNKPAASTRFALQLASFRTQQEAAKLQSQLRQRGYTVVVERIKVKRRSLYRVTVRSFPSRGEAERAARLLRREYGVNAVVVSARA